MNIHYNFFFFCNYYVVLNRKVYIDKFKYAKILHKYQAIVKLFIMNIILDNNSMQPPSGNDKMEQKNENK